MQGLLTTAPVPNLRVALAIALTALLLWCGVARAGGLPTPEELSNAAYSGNTQIVAAYLNGNGDPNVCVPIRPPEHADPAWSASEHWCTNLGRFLIGLGDEDLALLALRKGALEKPEQVQDALGVAIEANLPKVVEALIKRGAIVNQPAGAVDQPLMEAADEGRLQIVRELVTAGADINTTDSLGFTPIGTALMQGHEDVAGYLARHGASLAMSTSNGYQLISVAVIGGSSKFILALATLGFDVDAEDINGQTPLFLAVLAEKLPSDKRNKIIEMLLQRGADACRKDHHGRTPLDYAKSLRYSESAKLLEAATLNCRN